jgi:hypothetical protein
MSLPKRDASPKKQAEWQLHNQDMGGPPPRDCQEVCVSDVI